MDKSIKIKKQIYAIEKQIFSGKCKNIHAIRNKLKTLRKMLETALQFEFLAR